MWGNRVTSRLTSSYPKGRRQLKCLRDEIEEGECVFNACKEERSVTTRRVMPYQPYS